MILFIIFAIILIIFLIRFIWFRYINTAKIRSYFNHLSVCVCGKRGSGKDTLFSYLVYNKPHNSNIRYNNNTNIISLEDLTLGDISRHDLISGKTGFLNFEDKKHFNNPTFISDTNIYFPNFEDSKLKKEYSSMNISVSLWRHLYDSGLHFNCQLNGRLWKIIREQIEDTLMCLGCSRGIYYTKIWLRYYERPEDAEKGLKPLKPSRSSEVKVENSKRWLIKDYTVLIPNKMITHDSRYFKKIIFKEVLENESL